MNKIYNLEDFQDDRIIIYLIDQIYEFSKDKVNREWFYNAHLKQLGRNTTTLFALNEQNKIIGICNINYKENIISSIHINPKYKKIARLLIERSFTYLNTTKPYIKITTDNYNELKEIIEEYDWKLRKISKKAEFMYNTQNIKKKTK